MLEYERGVVDGLIASTSDSMRREIVDHVDGALAAMPEVIRIGVASQTVLLASWSAVRRRGRPIEIDDELAWLADHPVDLVQQWVRLLRSLVLFAECEMTDRRAATTTRTVGTP